MFFDLRSKAVSADNGTFCALEDLLPRPGRGERQAPVHQRLSQPLIAARDNPLPDILQQAVKERDEILILKFICSVEQENNLTVLQCRANCKFHRCCLDVVLTSDPSAAEPNIDECR